MTPKEYPHVLKMQPTDLDAARAVPGLIPPPPLDPIGAKLPRAKNYYQVFIEEPMDQGSAPYYAECADIIEALGMDFNEGEAFKALWRLAASRALGLQKNPAKYDAEKASHYAGRVLVCQTRKIKTKDAAK